MDLILKWLSVLFILLPRVSASYPFYFIAAISLFKFKNKRALAKLALFISFTGVFYLVNAIIYSTSISAFVVEFLLILPLLMYICGFELRYVGASAIDLIRNVNVGILILSAVGMMQLGFPFKLPHIHFSPDYYNAFYGLGGAKIVTLFGLFGLMAEAAKNSESGNHSILGKNKSLIYYSVAGCNFLIPSYMTGIVVGLIALTPFFLKKKFTLFFVCFTGFLVAPSLLFRLEVLEFYSLLDNPKIIALSNLFDLFAEHKATILFGAGLGQYVGTAALWANDVIVDISTHSIPNIPYFHMSQLHIDGIGSLISWPLSYWEISSSAKKPYSSFTSLYSELGVILGTYVIYGLLKRVKYSSPMKNSGYSLMILIGGMFLLDLWHDNYFFLYMLTLYTGVVNDEQHKVAVAPRSRSLRDNLFGEPP